MAQLDPTIFKAYDIRGIVGKTLTEDACHAIGQAFATLARRNGETAVNISRDGRLSGPALAQALSEGLRAGGVDVIDLGMNATPMLYYACATTPVVSGIQITGSHNPPEYNGLKMVLGGNALFGEQIQELLALTRSEAFAQGQGSTRQASIVEDYLGRIEGDIKLARPMKVVVDCGNGVSGAFAPRLLRSLGCEVVELFCEVDGTFPNHHPDPADPHNLEDLIRTVRDTGAELGLAFDGDGDRLGVVTPSGAVIWPDRQLMLYAADVLERHPGAPILFDVKCTAQLPAWVRRHGGEPVMGRTGHSLVKAKMKEIDAPLAGEMSGHIFFKDRWYGFDDAQYGAARLLEILSRAENAGAVLEALPDSVSTPELKLETAEGANFTLCERLQREGRFPGALNISTIDGVRADYADGFGLARPSNTTPCVVLRFEGADAAALARVQAEFRAALLALDASLKLPF
ncbi:MULTISPECIES: phosphomannomutase/phosphoglucomutase [unclassified Thiomonas]|uniref:phosphomannomutase/phosphoglucomutase n=1 Tax=unclassified Thiomonas TaxID=2625466 RepID=UPI0004DBC9DF|nr:MULTISPECIES: phosphomannomutase/phosphoglucomutase [unclassified Thiomonas]MDE2175342.1 phosphomannomutase/phosphoglucomutase [Betaproteobacteria bacterium]CDW94811.1 Phosphoglucomutase [Thiomonas sp. CB2]VDY04088.1 Phosphoglucomutase [Thiomonas sp. Bio17B3]VDY08739.1 Phosphoglucomutase [Thiomonas sp. Sup16B3]VDY12335.1 phosphomannomutase [Thiomonas sp. OC7]